MKIRTGFVSNSSSSSFIVAFKKEPKSVDEIKMLLFGNDEFFHDLYYGDEKYPTWQVAQTVFDDMKRNKKCSIKKMKEEMHYGTTLDYTKYEDKKTFKIDWDAYYKDAEKQLELFVENNKGSIFYIFEYGDNDGSYGSMLEHGNLFKLLPHLRISKH